VDVFELLAHVKPNSTGPQRLQQFALAANALSRQGQPGAIVRGGRSLGWNMVNRVVQTDRVLDEALALAHTALQGAPTAILRTKRLFDDLYSLPVGEHVNYALGLHKDMRTSSEAQEGLAAFQEKRPPNWAPDAANE